MNKKFVYHCRKYQKRLTKEDIRLHNCFHKKKGRNKDKPCSCLVRLPD